MSEGTSGGRAPWLRRFTPYAVGLVVAFTFYPFVSFLNRNRTEITQTGRLALYALIAALVALGALALLAALRPATSVNRLATGVAAFVVSFSSFHLVFSPDPLPSRRIPQLMAWAALTALLVPLVFRLSRFAQVRTFVLVLGVGLTAIPFSEYVIWQFTTDDAAAESEDSAAGEPADPPDVEAKPNVYYFILDEYGRIDQLKDVLGYDNRPFYDALSERDFTVLEDVHSPYQQTVMSMASVLDMDFVATSPDEAPRGNMPFANRIRGHNNTVEYFKALGYQYVYSSPGVFSWQRCEDDVVDLCIKPMSTGVNLSELEQSLLALTPVGSLNITKEAITNPSYVMDQLDEHRSELREPFFLYAHTLNPHGPFRYAPDCELRSEFAYSEFPLNKSELDQVNYVQDLGCLNEQVLDAVDRIVEDDPDAVVIVASDHGSKFIPDGYKRLEEWRPEAIREEFGTLFSIRLPEQCRESAEEMVNTINTFRIVTACLEGRPPDLVEDRAFIWPATGAGPQELDDLGVLGVP